MYIMISDIDERCKRAFLDAWSIVRAEQQFQLLWADLCKVRNVNHRQSKHLTPGKKVQVLHQILTTANKQRRAQLLFSGRLSSDASKYRSYEGLIGDFHWNRFVWVESQFWVVGIYGCTLLLIMILFATLLGVSNSLAQNGGDCVHCFLSYHRTGYPLCALPQVQQYHHWDYLQTFRSDLALSRPE